MTPADPLAARLAEIEARLEAATPGEWKVCPDELGGMPLVCLGPPDEHGGPICRDPLTTEDAVLIAHAPTDLAFLTTALRRAVEGLEWYEERTNALKRYMEAKPPQVTAITAVMQELALRAPALADIARAAEGKG